MESDAFTTASLRRERPTSDDGVTEKGKKVKVDHRQSTPGLTYGPRVISL